MTQNGFLGKKVLLKRWSYLLWIVRDFFGHREAPTEVKMQLSRVEYISYFKLKKFAKWWAK